MPSSYLTDSPSAALPHMRMLTMPYSEACVASGIAGELMLVVEEDRYVNGRTIPRAERRGCYAVRGDLTVPLLKSEAGWPAEDTY